MSKEVYIIAAKRTAVGGFLGTLSDFSATELAGLVIKDIMDTLAISKDDVDAVILGNVLSANLGQSPARQAAIYAGIPYKADATTVNKVCSSGLKSVGYAAQSIMLGESDLVIAGGMESMSNAPYYIEKHRKGMKAGHQALVDGMIKDGLWDPYNDFHMGNAAEMANRKYDISREEQDEYALSTYRKAEQATQSGFFKAEITPITITSRKGDLVFDQDEDINKLNPEKIKTLKPIFEKDGSVTAANASNLNDGAAILLLASKEYITKHDIQPLAKIIAFADAAQAPEWFTTSPSLAVEKLLGKTSLKIKDIDYFEINEAYANVALLNTRLLDIDADKVNVNGGSVAIGHPLGASGARILTTLSNTLKQNKAKYGIAAICNGGGGSTAMLIENLK